MQPSLSTDVSWQAEQARMDADLNRIETQMQSLEQQMAADAPKIRDESAIPAKEWTPQETVKGWDEFDKEMEAKHAASTSDQIAEKVLSVFEPGKVEAHEGGVQWHESGEHVLEEVGDAAAEHEAHTAEHHLAPPPLPKKSVQWFYAVDDESKGPVSEDELLKLFADGTVKMSSLVWNKTLKEWRKASETVLADKLENAPPPLPKAQTASPEEQAIAKRDAISSECPACGYATEPSDRFCPGCGKPLER